MFYVNPKNPPPPPQKKVQSNWLSIFFGFVASSATLHFSAVFLYFCTHDVPMHFFKQASLLGCGGGKEMFRK